MYFQNLNKRKKELLQSMNIEELIDLIEEQDEKIKELQQHKDTSIGLWCIDQNPKDVEYDWIINNAFQLD